MSNQKSSEAPQHLDGITFKKEFIRTLSQGIIPKEETTLDALVNLEQVDNSNQIYLNVATFIPEDQYLAPLAACSPLDIILKDSVEKDKALVYFHYNTAEVIDGKYRNLEIHYKTKKDVESVADFAIFYFRISYSLPIGIENEKVSVRDINHSEANPRTSRGTKTMVSQ